MAEDNRARIDMSSSPLSGFERALLAAICSAAAVFLYMLFR